MKTSVSLPDEFLNEIICNLIKIGLQAANKKGPSQCSNTSQGNHQQKN